MVKVQDISGGRNKNGWYLCSEHDGRNGERASERVYLCVELIMDIRELIKELREDAEWAEANEWEVPIMLSDHLRTAADIIEGVINEDEMQG